MANQTVTGDEGTTSLEAFVENLGQQIVREHGSEAFAALAAASNHAFNCRCSTCLQWWAHCGPEWEDEDTPAGYGPFTKGEVNAEQRRLNLQVTP